MAAHKERRSSEVRSNNDNNSADDGCGDEEVEGAGKAEGKRTASAESKKASKREGRELRKRAASSSWLRRASSRDTHASVEEAGSSTPASAGDSGCLEGARRISAPTEEALSTCKTRSKRQEFDNKFETVEEFEAEFGGDDKK